MPSGARSSARSIWCSTPCRSSGVHELSVAGAVLDTVERHADGRPVTVVRLRVGRLRQVVPESLQFYWEIVVRGTAHERARLELEDVEAQLACSECGRRWEPELPV